MAFWKDVPQEHVMVWGISTLALTALLVCVSHMETSFSVVGAAMTISGVLSAFIIVATHQSATKEVRTTLKGLVDDFPGRVKSEAGVIHERLKVEFQGRLDAELRLKEEQIAQGFEAKVEGVRLEVRQNKAQVESLIRQKKSMIDALKKHGIIVEEINEIVEISFTKSFHEGQ